MMNLMKPSNTAVTLNTHALILLTEKLTVRDKVVNITKIFLKQHVHTTTLTLSMLENYAVHAMVVLQPTLEMTLMIPILAKEKNVLRLKYVERDLFAQNRRTKMVIGNLFVSLTQRTTAKEQMEHGEGTLLNPMDTGSSILIRPPVTG